MKKVIFRLLSLAMIVSLFMTSCKKDDETKELTLSQLSVTMVHDDTLTITANQKVEWASKDEFVAKISSDGKITARHIGETSVTATIDGQQKECKVTVKPVYNTYSEPVLNFDLAKSEIKTKEKRHLVEETDTSLTYSDKTKYLLTYLFSKTTSKFRAVYLYLNDITTSQASQIADFQTERYQPITIDKNTYTYYMINSDKMETATMAVSTSFKTQKLQLNAIIVYEKIPVVN